MGAQLVEADGREVAGAVRRHHLAAVHAVHEHPIGRELELPGAGVADVAVGVAQHEEALAVHREVEVVAGLAQLALREVHRRGVRRQAIADLAAAEGVSAGKIGVRIEHVGELEGGALEARRVEVGRVVRDDAQPVRVAHQATHADVDGFEHVDVSRRGVSGPR